MSTQRYLGKQEVLYIPVLANLSVNSGSDTLTGATTVNFKNGGTTVSSVTVSQECQTPVKEYATSTTATLTSVDIFNRWINRTIEIEEKTL
ncbi:MAG: hypothetical protein CM15mV88_400 [Caudoviricetes sp.]|nr:MAG: hypothetical protein CM15mV88_400 [Caudoviricetes sp.]